MEWWNAGILVFKKILTILILSLILIFPLIRHCIIPEPIIPLFQHSNIPTFQLGRSPSSNSWIEKDLILAEFARIGDSMRDAVLTIMNYVKIVTGVEPTQEEIAEALKSYFILNEVGNQINPKSAI